MIEENPSIPCADISISIFICHFSGWSQWPQLRQRFNWTQRPFGKWNQKNYKAQHHGKQISVGKHHHISTPSSLHLWDCYNYGFGGIKGQQKESSTLWYFCWNGATRGLSCQFFGQISAQNLSKILNVWVKVWTKQTQKSAYSQQNLIRDKSA